MKRSLSIIISVALGLTLAPVGATATPSASPATGSVALASDSSQQERATVEVDSKKKKCTYMCVQSTLPTVEEETYFVNGNRHLISINTTNFTRRNLDTKKVTDRADYPGGIALTGSAISRDESTLIIAGTNDAVDFGNLHFLTVDTETFDMTELTRDSTTTHPLTSEVLYEIAVSPDNAGFYLVQRHEGASYLCRFGADGQEIGCSASFAGSVIPSPIFFDETGAIAYVVANRVLYTFDTTDLSFDEVSIGDYEISPNGVMAADGNMYFYDNVGFDFGGDTSVYQVTPRGNVTVVAEIPGSVMIRDIATSSIEWGLLYLLGKPINSSGQSENYNRVYSIDMFLDPASAVRSFKIKPSRGYLPERLGLDTYGRYLLAFSYGGPTSVIPVEQTGSVRVITTSAYVTTPSAGWQIDWDYVNLAPGAKLKKYQVWYKAPNTTKWRKSGQINAGGEHTTVFTAGVSRGLVKVLPIGIRVNSYNFVELVGECTIPRVGAPQPIC